MTQPYGITEKIGILNVVQNGAQVTMTSLPTSGGSCAYSGTLQQFGQLGDVVGIFSCTNGGSGSFHIFEFQVTPTSVTGRFTAAVTSAPACLATGWFGGLAVTTF